MPSHSARNLARTYYALAGLIAVAAAAVAIASAIGSAAGGCEIIFSQADFVNAPQTGPIPDDLPACQQFFDVSAVVIELALAAALLLTAVLFGQQGSVVRALVRAGALLGIVVGALPGAFVWWLMAYYRQTPGPVEFAIGGLPLLAGLLAAWVTWRVHRNPDVEMLEPAATE